MFHCKWVYSTPVGSFKCRVSRNNTSTGASTLCPTAISEDDFKEFSILALFKDLDHTLHSLLSPACQNAFVNTYIRHRLACE